MKGICNCSSRASVLLAFFAFLLVPVIMFPIAAVAAPSYESGPEPNYSFKDVEGKEWLLVEVRTPGKTVFIDRRKLEADNMGGFLTISFRENQAAGVGAPNRFFGPCTAGANRSLIVGQMASTMMLAFREPDELKEREYFNYLGMVNAWNIKNGKLELSGGSSGTVLVFNSK